MKNFYALETDGYDTVKSFYGRANVIIMEDDTIVLRSYDTDVVRIRDGKIERLWDDYSRTTMRHVSSFARQHGFSIPNKKAWDSMEVVKEV